MPPVRASLPQGTRGRATLRRLAPVRQGMAQGKTKGMSDDDAFRKGAVTEQYAFNSVRLWVVPQSYWLHVAFDRAHEIN